MPQVLLNYFRLQNDALENDWDRMENGCAKLICPPHNVPYGLFMPERVALPPTGIL
jgi:hypothetical protein